MSLRGLKGFRRSKERHSAMTRDVYLKKIFINEDALFGDFFHLQKISSKKLMFFMVKKKSKRCCSKNCKCFF